MISALQNAWKASIAASLTPPSVLAIGPRPISHDGYPPSQRQTGSSHTAADTALDAELKHPCLENGYKPMLHCWQLRPEHVAISWCLLLHDHFEDASHFDALQDTGISRPQQLVDLSSWHDLGTSLPGSYI